MKKKLIFLCLLLFIAYILTAPKDAVNAASVGLVLWYTRVLPTLLPFVILSNILMDSNYLQYLNKITAPLVSRLIPVSDNGAFVLLSGFLFGFPIGSKNCAALLASGKITRREADVLFIITNNISPVFVTSFHPLHPAWAVPSVGSYPADPVFSGAFAGQYPALCRRTPHKRPHRVPRAKTAGIWISNEF